MTDEAEALRGHKARDDAIQAALAAITVRIEALAGASSSFRDLVADKLVDHPASGVGTLPEVAAPDYGTRPPPPPLYGFPTEAPALGDRPEDLDYAAGEVTERRLGEVQRGLLGVQGGLRELAHASDALGRTLRGLADGTIRLPSIDAVEQRTDELGRRLLRRLDGVEQSLAAAVRDEQAWLRAGLPPELAAKAQTAIVASLEPLETALHQRLDQFVDTVLSGVSEALKETEDAVVERIQEEVRAEQRAMSRRLEKRLDMLTQEVAEQGALGGHLEEIVDGLAQQLAGGQGGLGAHLEALEREIGGLVKAENATALQLLNGRLEERLDALAEELGALQRAEKATGLKLTGVRGRLADALAALDRLSTRPGTGSPELAEVIEVNRLVVERLEELSLEMQTVRRRLPVRGPVPRPAGTQPAAVDEEDEEEEEVLGPPGRGAPVPGLPGRQRGSRGPLVPGPGARRASNQRPPVRRAGEEGPPPAPRRRPTPPVKLVPPRGPVRDSG